MLVSLNVISSSSDAGVSLFSAALLSCGILAIRLGCVFGMKPMALRTAFDQMVATMLSWSRYFARSKYCCASRSERPSFETFGGR